MVIFIVICLFCVLFVLKLNFLSIELRMIWLILLLFIIKIDNGNVSSVEGKLFVLDIFCFFVDGFLIGIIMLK